MQNIALPKKTEFKKGDKANSGSIIIEPCYPGYGMTLGNALRRVLLSSLPGAAAVGVKIKGADHEFKAVPHIKEDVLEIILNLKQLRLKLHTDEVVKLQLDVHGEKTVKAGDIVKNSEVEIINPDLVLAHITDMAGSLNMEIFVSRGRGYETIETREKPGKNETGYIEMDSIFSPILSVGIKVEPVRVGKMTNWDKLILDILTDGTITPEEGFKKSVEILIKQFSALNPEVVIEEEVKEEKIEPQEEEKEEAKEEAEPQEEKKKRGRPKKTE